MDFSNITSADLEGVGLGLVSEVFRIRDTNVVAKLPAISAMFGPELHDIERKVYEGVSKHPHILQYLGQSPAECRVLKGALLFEYHSRGMLRPCIHDLHRISPQFLELPRQVASGLAHIQSLGVVHCNLGLHNLLLTDSGDVVLCNFAGSSIDGARPGEVISHRNDVFALGTLMYEIACGNLLFEGLEDWEISERLERRQFPDLSDLPVALREVIEKCWTVPEYTARDAVKALDRETSRAATAVVFAPGVLLLVIAAWRMWRRP